MRLVVLCAVLAITLAILIDVGVEGGDMVPVKTKACDAFCSITSKSCLKRCNGFFLGFLQVHTTNPKGSGSHEMARVKGSACDYFCKMNTQDCLKGCQGFFINFLQVHTTHPNKKSDESMEHPWDFEDDRAELDAIKEDIWEEDGPSYEQDALIVADPFIGQLGSYGGHCTTPCTNHGHRYFWCWADTVRWDYCSPNNGDLTAYGRKCRHTSKCGHGKGHRYTWCWTTTARWDYCIPEHAAKHSDKHEGHDDDEMMPNEPIVDNQMPQGNDHEVKTTSE